MINHPDITSQLAEAHHQHLLDTANHYRLVREARNTTKTAKRTFGPSRFTVRVAGWYRATPRTA